MILGISIVHCVALGESLPVSCAQGDRPFSKSHSKQFVAFPD